MFLDEYSFEKQIPSIMTGVYGWMSCALAITAGTAYYVAMTPTIFMYITQPGIAIGLLFAQLFFVFGLIFFINRMSFVTALLFFLLYSCSLGVTLASLFYIYTKASIISTFLTTAITFGCMSLYGYFTKADLTSIGNLGFMALIGLIVGMIINMFLASTQFDYILLGFGVIVFVMLTAYDTQKIKQLARTFFSEQESLQKITIIGALTLYLDFINLFLFLLRFLGKKDER